MPHLLGSILTTWHNVHTMNRVPVLPVRPEYEVPRHPYGLTAHILTHPSELRDARNLWMANRFMFPSHIFTYHPQTYPLFSIGIYQAIWEGGPTSQWGSRQWHSWAHQIRYN